MVEIPMDAMKYNYKIDGFGPKLTVIECNFYNIIRKLPPYNARLDSFFAEPTRENIKFWILERLVFF
jgi:hypothetical protein